MVEPVVASVVAWAWLGETLSTTQLVGGAVVLLRSCSRRRPATECLASVLALLDQLAQLGELRAVAARRARRPRPWRCRSLDQRRELDRVERLRHVVEAAEVEAAGTVAQLGAGGQEDDRDRARRRDPRAAPRRPASRRGPGIITSSRITSGLLLRAVSSPVGPSAASSTSIFSASRLTRHSSRIGASSSTTSTRRASRIVTRRPRSSPSRAGSSTTKLEPSTLVGVDTVIRPPSALTRPCAMNSPTPVPPVCASPDAVELREDPLLLGVRDADALVRRR